MTSRSVPFQPSPGPREDIVQLSLPRSRLPQEKEWVPVLSCILEFSAEHFHQALETITLHPEFNSSIILRADVLKDEIEPGLPSQDPSWHPLRCLRRKILPRRPDRDSALEQDCLFYSHSASDKQASLVVLVPDVPAEGNLPFYHPKVSAIAFQHQTAADGRYSLTIHVVPLDAADNSYLDITSRLYRICVSLAESIWRIGFGKRTGYQKKVHHDVVIDRDEYQDFYLVMRELHKSEVESWGLDTDPLKHVYEDIGIATFLLLLWKHTYPTREPAEEFDPVAQPWHSWGRPPGGYIDFGCGNGLLVHILVKMGYADGIGIDLRARPTWEMFPEATRERLQVHAYNPTTIESAPPLIKLQSFLIGNHSDELTPWIPILAVLSDSAFLSIPCCPWTLDVKFTKPKGFHKREKSPSEEELQRRLEARGSGGATSLYATFLQWHFSQAIACGFDAETEVLRIPSSRNWAVIGRHRLAADDPAAEEAFKEKALSMIAEVRERGVFKTRTPEGKAGKEHR